MFLTIPAGDVAVSLSELADAAAEGLLYSGGGHWAEALGLAADLDVLVCGTLPSLDAFRNVATCSAAAAGAVLLETPRLASDPPARLPLTRLILDDQGAERAYRTLRHLLVGRITGDLEPLLAPAATGTDEAWPNLLIASGVDVAAVPAPLAKLLNDEQKKVLKLEDLDAGAVLNRVGGVAADALSALTFSEAAAHGLHEAALDFAARNASPAQLHVLRVLPIHPTMSGERAACTRSAYVNAGGADLGALPRALQERVTLLRPHPNETQRVGQKKLVSDLDATQTLHLLVKHEEAAEVVTGSPVLFMQLLAQADKLSGDLPERLAKLAWVPTPLGLRAPRDVLRLPFSALRWTGKREVSLADLRDDLFKRPTVLFPLMPDRDGSLERLAGAAAADERFRTGVRLSLEDDDKLHVDNWLRFFDAAQEVMPAVGLLREVTDATWPGNVEGRLLLPKVLGSLAVPLADPTRIVGVLDLLAQRAEEGKVGVAATARRLLRRLPRASQDARRLEQSHSAGPAAPDAERCLARYREDCRPHTGCRSCSPARRGLCRPASRPHRRRPGAGGGRSRTGGFSFGSIACGGGASRI